MEARLLLTVEPISTVDPGLFSDTGDGTSQLTQEAASISADGQLIVFQSSANDLVPNDRNQANNSASPLADVFLFNRATGETSLISVNTAGTSSGNENSFNAKISADGRYVLFESEAGDLTNESIITGGGSADIFLRDLQTGTTTLISKSLSGTTGGNGGSKDANISADGRYVVFSSSASNLVSGDTNGVADIFIRDLLTSTTTLVSHVVGNTAAGGNNHSYDPRISDDGRFVAFGSSAGNLVANQGTNNSDIFVWDRQTSAIELISVDSNEVNEANADTALSVGRAFSADGRYVLFETNATNLVPEIGNVEGRNVYRRDRQLGTTVAVTLSANGLLATGGGAATMTADGRYVAFVSGEGDLIAGLSDTNGGSDVYVRDMQLGVTELISRNAAATGTGNRQSGTAQYPFDFSAGSLVLSTDGRFVGFTSEASNLVVGQSDPNDARTESFGTHRRDVFVRDRLTGTTNLISKNFAGSATGENGSFTPAMSADGSVVAFESLANDLVAGSDPLGKLDVFVRDVSAGITELASQRTSQFPDGRLQNGGGGLTSATPDGRFVAYTSSSQVFVLDRLTESVDQISHRADGTPDNGSSGQLSADGRFVAFNSNANLASVGPSGTGSQIWVHDRLTDETRLVSVTPAGVAAGGNEWSSQVAFTQDGRYVAWTSSAHGLVDNFVDGNGTGFTFGVHDIFIRDLHTGVTRLVSHIPGSSNESGNAGSQKPAFSADGSQLIFTSRATNLVAGITDTSNTDDLFAYDVESGAIELISINSAGTATGNGGSADAVVSADGRYVAFITSAGNIGFGGVTGRLNVYVRDLDLNTTALVSVNSAGTGSGGAHSYQPSISADGRYVAFASEANSLVAGDTGRNDVFVRDMVNGITTRVSVTPSGGTASFHSNNPVISPDGRYVSFESEASDLVANYVDLNGGYENDDLYVRDLVTGVTDLVSVNDSGTGSGNLRAVQDDSLRVFTADGKTLFFTGNPSDFVAGDRNAVDDVFAYSFEGAGQIRGTLFNDADGDGTQDAGEVPLPFWTVYVDADGDRRLGGDERSVRTDLAGNYALTGLPAGTHTVALVLPDGFTRTIPTGLAGSYSVALATDTSIVTGQMFGVQAAQVDLDVAFISAPANALPGQEVNVSWSVRNAGVDAIISSFQDAVYFSTDQTLDAGDMLLATVPHTGSLAAGSSYVGSVAVTMPAVLSGDYFVIIQTDRRHQVGEETNRANNVLAATTATTIVSPPILPLATPTSGQFGNVLENRYFQINVAEGETLSVVLDSAAADGATELYISRLHLPTPADYDFAAVAFQPDQEVLVRTTTAPGVYYVLARSRASGSTPEFTITASVVGFELNGIDRTIGENTGKVTLRIDGSRLTPTTAISLVNGGTTIIAETINVQDSGTLFATFNLTGQQVGTYEVVATEGANTATLPAAFQVVPTPGVTIQDPYLIEIITPASLRQGRQSSILIQYTNTTNVDQPAPLLAIRANTRIRLVEQRDFIGDFDVESRIDFLGIAPDGPAGILRPGQTGTQRVMFLTKPGEEGFTANFNVDVLDPGGSTSVDWNEFKAGMQPPTIPNDAWDAIFANFLTQVGTTTRDYVRLLGDNASYLSQLGIRTSDVARLLGFEVQQAAGSFAANDNPGVTDAALATSGSDLVFSRQFNNDIAGRYRIGPFGRGWSHNWDISAAVDADGNVTIDQGGVIRYFTRLADGSYRGGTGDTAKLTLVSGAFRVRELGGLVVQFRTDAKLDFVEDPNGNRITAGYDGSGRLQTLTSNSGGVGLTLAYNPGGQIASLVDSNGESVTYAYDPSGEHLTGYIDRYGNHVYTYVTGQGPEREHALAEIAFSDDTHILYAYDSQGRQIERKRDGDQERVTYQYDTAAGITVTPAVGGSVTVLSNDFGRPELVRNALGHTTRYDYDTNNQLTQLVTPSGLTYAYEFCACGSPLSTTDPLGQTVTFEYEDTFKNLVGYTDAKGITTEYDYDSNGNLTAMTYADGSQQRASYDAFGNLESTVNRRGHVIDHDYDSRGRLTKTTFANGTTQVFNYDSHDNLSKVTDSTGDTLFTHDPLTNALTKVSYPGGRFLEYTYNIVNQRTRSTDQDGFIVNYLYDDLGRLDKLTDGADALIVDYTYDASGRLIRRDNGNATFTTYQYDAASQLLTLTHSAPDATVNSKFEYTYDAEGRRSSMKLTDNDPGTADGTTVYGYDAAGQLVSVALPGGRTIAYTYDANGNRTQVADSLLGTTVFEVNDLNQVTQAGDTTFYYDPDGNLIQVSDGTSFTSYTFDDQNRLLCVNGPAGNFAYEYDAFGNRRAATRDGARTEYLIDPTRLVNVAAEYGLGDALVAHYTAGLGVTSRVAANGTATYFDFDATGNTVGITDSAGDYANRYTYLPFSETTTVQATVPNLFQFVGEFGVQTSGDGLALMHFRNYSTQTGQFISDDPLNLNGGDTNLRRYVGNDPVSGIDPTGLEKCPPLNWDKLRDEIMKWLKDNGIDPSNPKVWQDLLNKMTPTPIKGMDTPWKMIQDQVMKFNDWAFKQITGQMNAVNAAASKSSGGDPPNAGPSNNCPLPTQPPKTTPKVSPTKLAKGKAVGTVGSLDPNDIVGPGGFGSENFLAETALLPFVIHFENESSATAPAQEVFVTHTLNVNLDLSTFELGDFGFGQLIVEVPAGLQAYSTRVDFTNPDSSPLFVDVSAALNPATRVVTWTFRSVDPATGEFPEDALAGFLPPNDETQDGEGFVEFLIRPLPGLTTGTEIRSIASIVFDTNIAIATNQVDPHNPAAGTDPNKEALITIDAAAPTSSVMVLPASISSADFIVHWSGSDDAGGSGIASFDLFVSDNGGPFTTWLDDTMGLSATYTGQLGHTYAFYSVASDNVGHIEAAPATPDATTALIQPSVLDMGGLAITFINKQQPVIVLPQISVAGADLGGGTLSITVNAIGKKQKLFDRFAIPSASSIGTISGPTFANGQLTVQIQLSEGATASLIRSFLRGITFSTKGKGLNTTVRTMTVTLANSSGLSSTVHQTINVVKKVPRAST